MTGQNASLEWHRLETPPSAAFSRFALPEFITSVSNNQWKNG
jgi:hypothetical protein